METVQQKQSLTCLVNCLHHPSETFLSVCVERTCSKRYELCCQQCTAEKHINHNLISLSRFFESYNNQREMYFHDLDSQIQKLVQSYEGIENDFNRAIGNITIARDLVKNSIQSFKKEFNLFEDEVKEVEDLISNIKRRNVTFEETQHFIDKYVEKSSFHCSFKDINKSNTFQTQAKQFLAYFTECPTNNKIFGDSAKSEGILLNLKSLNGSAEVIKNQARILLSPKQDLSYLNKEIGNGSYSEDIDKIPIKDLTMKQWNELQNILDSAGNEVLYSLPQIDFTIDLSINTHQKEQIISLFKNNKKLKTLRMNIKHFQQFEDGSLSETLNEYQSKLENLEILQQSGIYQEQHTRKLLETFQFASLRKLKLDIQFQKPQMHNEVLKIISENHWLEDINLSFCMPDKSRQKIKEYLTVISQNQILKKLKLNFDCSANPPYVCQDTLKLIEQFFTNNKEIQMFILGKNIVCEYYKEFHKILKEFQNPNLRVFEIDAKPAHRTLSIFISGNQQEQQKSISIIDNNPNLTSVKLHNFDSQLNKIFTTKKKALQILTQLSFRMCKFRREIIQDIFYFLEETLVQGVNDQSKVSKAMNRIFN